MVVLDQPERNNLYMKLNTNFLYIDSFNNFYIKSLHYDWCVGVNKKYDEFIPNIKHVNDMKSAVTAADFIITSIDSLMPGDLIFSCPDDSDLTNEMLNDVFRYSIVFNVNENGVDVIKNDMSDIKIFWDICPRKFYKIEFLC